MLEQVYYLKSKITYSYNRRQLYVIENYVFYCWNTKIYSKDSYTTAVPKTWSDVQVICVAIFRILNKTTYERCQKQIHPRLYSTVLGYADNIGIIGRSLRAATEAFLALEGLERRLGLIINESKTKYMVTGQEARDGELSLIHIQMCIRDRRERERERERPRQLW